MDTINTDQAPKAIGPYSQAVKVGVTAGGFLFCSGQLPLRADGTFVDSGIEEQTLQVLNNLKAILETGGSSISKVVKTTVYLSDMTLFESMNKIYGDFFGGHKPARATVGIAKLPKNALIEIDCIAVVE